MTAQAKLFNGIIQGNIDVVSEAIKEGANLEVRHETGYTPLILAIKLNQLAIIKLFLEKGVDIDQGDVTRSTALHWAVKTNNLDVVKLLVTRHATFDLVNKEGDTPLVLAKQLGYGIIKSFLTQIVIPNPHYEQLELRNNIQLLTSEQDAVSLVATQLNYLPAGLDLKLKSKIDSIRLQLVQPEELLEFFGKGKISKSPKADKTLARQSAFDEILNKPLKASDTVFNTFNKLLKDIVQVKQQLIEPENASVEVNNLVSLLTKVEQFYKRYQFYLCDNQISFDKRLDLIKGNPRLRGFLGYRYLNAGATMRFSPYLFKQQENNNMANQDNKPVSPSVIELNGVHYKIRPHAPGIEYAVGSLSNIIAGHGVTATELLLFEHTQESVPVLASKSVPGQNLIDLLQQEPSALDVITSYNYSSQVILAILTKPSDAKLDNYMAVIDVNKQRKIESLQLVGINNDRAFELPILKSSEQINNRAGKHFVQLKTLFFCLPQMAKPIDAGFRREFLKQTPILITLYWLKSMLHQEAKYLRYKDVSSSIDNPDANLNVQASITKEEYFNLNLFLRLMPGTVKQVYAELKQLQQLLRENPTISHQELLYKMNPLLGIFYQHVREFKPHVMDAVSYIYSNEPPALETLLHEDVALLHQLQRFNLSNNEMQPKFNQTLEDACIDLINGLDYAEIPDTQAQGYVLDRITSDFKFIKELRLKNCQALNDIRLENLVSNLKKLNKLQLINCKNINGTGLTALLNENPHIHISLDVHENLSTNNLLALLRYAQNLKLVLSGKEYYARKQTAELLKDALLQAQTNLIVALLMVGAHLGNDRNSELPLHVAIQTARPGVVKMLLGHGIPVDTLNHQWESGLDIALRELQKTTIDAKKFAYQAIITALLNHGAIVTKQPEAIINEFLNYYSKKKHLLTPSLRQKVFTYCCCHNLLALYPDLLELLISPTIERLDFSLPQHLKLYNFTLTKAIIQKMQQSFVHLKSVAINGCQGLTAELLTELTIMPLHVLEIDFDQAQKANLATLDKIHEAFDLKLNQVEVRIVTLNLGGRKLEQPDLMLKIGAFVRKNNGLKSIELGECQLTEAQIKLLAGSLAKCEKLEMFALDKNRIGDNGIKILLPVLQQLKWLTDLSLNEADIQLEGAQALATLLEMHPTLKSLSLYDNPIKDEGIAAIAKALQTGIAAKQLERLTINQIQMTESGIQALAKALWFNKSLMYLDMGYNQIKDKGTEKVIELLQLNKYLKEVKANGLGASTYLTNELHQLIVANQQLIYERELMLIGERLGSSKQYAAQRLLPPEYQEIIFLKEEASLRKTISMQQALNMPQPVQSMAASMPFFNLKNESLPENNPIVSAKTQASVITIASINRPLPQVPVVVPVESNNNIITSESKQLNRFIADFTELLSLAKNGDTHAQTLLGERYIKGEMLAKDIKKAQKWLLLASNEVGALPGIWARGLRYEYGLNSQQDFSLAVAFYQEAAEENYAPAQVSLALCYKHGVGVESNEKIAMEWLQKAVEQNYPVAQYQLGLFYQRARTIARNVKQAVYWFLEAAKQGYAPAQEMLGECYEKGQGAIKDEKQAVNWYQQATSNGYTVAEFKLGLCYKHGVGIGKDEKQAVYWFQKAAEQQYPPAQNALGICYETGSGIEKDDFLAVHWYEKAAYQDNSQAQYNLGRCYELGVGTNKDPRSAAHWYEKAAGQGNNDAEKALERFPKVVYRLPYI